MNFFKALCLMVFVSACGKDATMTPNAFTAGSVTEKTTILTETKIDCASIDPSFSQVGDTCVSMCVACLKDGGECNDTNKNGYGDTCVMSLPSNPTPTEPPVQTTETSEPPKSECQKGNEDNLGYKIGGACMGNYGVCEVVGTFECVNAEWTCSVDPKGSQSKSSQSEICGDNLDNDCNGQTDEGCGCKFGELTTVYTDSDDDGFGVEKTAQQMCVAEVMPAGYTFQFGDCNDSNSDVHPGAPETCGDKLDNNCDGQTDEGCDCPDVKQPLTASEGYVGWCNKCSGECKTLPDIPMDASSFKLVVVLNDLVLEDKLFAITESIQGSGLPQGILPSGKSALIAKGERIGVIDLDPGTFSIWYAVCNTMSNGGCDINEKKTSPYVTEFYPLLADQVFLVQNLQWIDLTSKMKPALAANTSVHGEAVTF